MSDLPTLKSLLERVEAATRPDRELDGAIWRETVGFDPDRMLPRSWPDIGSPASPFPPLTASLDAALSLVNEMLPGWWWSIEATGGQTGTGKTIYHARVHGVHEGQRAFGMTASTPTLALLAALLRALIQKETEGHA